jgi:hypothetical protein
MGGFGIPMVEGKELDFQEYDLDKAKEYALSFTWERSADLWKLLIRGQPLPHNPSNVEKIPGESLPREVESQSHTDTSTGEAESHIDVDSNCIIQVNDVEKPYVEVDSTGFIVNGDADICREASSFTG